MFFFGRQKDRGKFDIFFLRFSQHDTKVSLLELLENFQGLEFRFMRVFLKKVLLYQRKDIRLLMTREIKKEILSRNLPILNCSRWLKMR